MSRLLLINLIVLPLFVGCASKTTFVQYDASSASSADWFPIPSDAPAEVEVSEPELPRVSVVLSEETAVDEDSVLAAERLEDSIGNISLRVNRQTGAAWELVESALDQLDIRVFDKNRDEYRFELANEGRSKGLFSVFKTSKELNIVLIPQGGNTVIVVEGQDDIAPDTASVEDILSQLLNYFQAI